MNEQTNTARRATVPCPSCQTLNRLDLGRTTGQPKCGRCGTPIPVDQPIAVADRNLERVVSSTDVPVLVDFYADWCGPCRMMAPTLDAIARDNSGDVLVARLDTDRNPTMAVRFAIRGIPTLIAFAGGREVARETGAVPRPRLDALIARARSIQT